MVRVRRGLQILLCAFSPFKSRYCTVKEASTAQPSPLTRVPLKGTITLTKSHTVLRMLCKESPSRFCNRQYSTAHSVSPLLQDVCRLGTSSKAAWPNARLAGCACGLRETTLTDITRPGVTEEDHVL